MFSAAEVQAWEDTVAAYSGASDSDSPWAEDDQEAEGWDELDVADLMMLIDGILREAVVATLRDRSAEPAREAAALVLAGDLATPDEPRFAEQEAPGDETSGQGDFARSVAAAADQPSDEVDELAVTGGPLVDGTMGLSMAFAVLAGWLTGVREREPDERMAEDAVEWVRAEIGADAAGKATRAAGLLGGQDGAGSTVQELLDELQADFLPALTWLAAGAVARCGGGDAEWLPALDPPPADLDID